MNASKTWGALVVAILLTAPASQLFTSDEPIELTLEAPLQQPSVRFQS
jgi:hypothetical protein